MSARTWLPGVMVIAIGAVLGLVVAGPPSGSDDATSLPTPTSAVNVPTSVASPAGPATTAPPIVVPPFQSVLKVGSRGDAVTLWQQRMKDRGWPMAVDGQFSAEAQTTARDFQQQKSLPVTGQVDQATWDAAWTAPLPDDVTQ
jgi:peptidoglycan hydrolase-like protein with peptidoglycan-binding domain